MISNHARWSLVLDAELGQVAPKLDAILKVLQEITQDKTLRLKELRTGSVILMLEGSREGYKLLEALYKSGQLKEVLGIPVLGVNWNESDGKPQQVAPPMAVSLYSPESASTVSAQAAPRSPTTIVAPVKGVIDFAILTAIEVERRAVCEAFRLTDDDRVFLGARVYWRGRVPLKKNGESYEIIVAQCADMANVDAALLTSDALRDWEPAATLLVGIAASTDDKVRLGDVVAGSEVYYYERGKVGQKRTKPEPKILPADATLWSRVSAVRAWDGKISTPRPDGNGCAKLHYGLIASGEKVIAQKAARDKIAAQHRKIVAIAMEDYGFSKAVWQSFRQVRHLCLRGICDDGTENKDDRWHGYAAAAAAAFAKHFLLDRPLDPRSNVPSNHAATPPALATTLAPLLREIITVLNECLKENQATFAPLLLPNWFESAPSEERLRPLRDLFEHQRHRMNFGRWFGQLQEVLARDALSPRTRSSLESIGESLRAVHDIFYGPRGIDSDLCKGSMVEWLAHRQDGEIVSSRVREYLENLREKTQAVGMAMGRFEASAHP